MFSLGNPTLDKLQKAFTELNVELFQQKKKLFFNALVELTNEQTSKLTIDEKPWDGAIVYEVSVELDSNEKTYSSDSMDYFCLINGKSVDVRLNYTWGIKQLFEYHSDLVADIGWSDLELDMDNKWYMTIYFVVTNDKVEVVRSKEYIPGYSE
jgi:hypothetical protein